MIHFFVLIAFSVVLGAQAESSGAYVTRNTPDEPVAVAFSKTNAVDFIERSVEHWQTSRKCVTCHTNGSYLVAGSQLTPESKVFLGSQAFSREYLTKYVSGNAKPKGQHGAIEGLVSTASYLAISEMTTTGRLHAKTAAALDHIWTRQSLSGAWENWLKCHWGPFEVDDHFGVSLAMVAVSMAPERYRSKPEVKRARDRMHTYLTSKVPTSAHQKTMLLWAARHAPALVTARQKKAWMQDLRELQLEDGGWALIDLGDDRWQREDAKPQYEGSDGYATGMVVFALRQAGVASDDPDLQRGVAWLKSNQRQSGRWFTYSPRRDGKHYISQAATNMALLALHSCGELD